MEAGVGEGQQLLDVDRPAGRRHRRHGHELDIPLGPVADHRCQLRIANQLQLEVVNRGVAEIADRRGDVELVLGLDDLVADGKVGNGDVRRVVLADIDDVDGTCPGRPCGVP